MLVTFLVTLTKYLTSSSLRESCFSGPYGEGKQFIVVGKMEPLLVPRRQEYKETHISVANEEAPNHLLEYVLLSFFFLQCIKYNDRYFSC